MVLNKPLDPVKGIIMRVPVLLILPAQNLLQESATAAAKRKPPTDISKVRRPSMVEIDTSFHAVPFATGKLEESPSLAKHAPSASWHLADMLNSPTNVRFWGQNGH